MVKTRTRIVTLLDVVRTVQDLTRSDREVVAVVAHLFRSRSVVRPWNQRSNGTGYSHTA
jgi:hypothetical protein